MNSLEFFENLQKSDFGRKYLTLVESCRDRELKKEPGYEIHHVFPRCFGGSNEKSNLVKLTVYEHLLGHYYLVKALDHPKLWYSFSFIIGPQFNKLTKEERLNLQELEGWAQLRESALHRHLTEEHKQRIGQANKGKLVGVKRPKELVEQIIRSRIESGHSKHSKETIEKIRIANTGRKRSEEYKLRMSKLKKGCPGFFTGKSHSPESNEKNRKAHTGRVHINNGVQAKMVHPSEVQQFLEEGWVLGRIWKKSKKI